MNRQPVGLFLKLSFFNTLRYDKKIRLIHKWITPSGFDTGIKVYNRKKNEKVPLILSNKNFVKWYICGPTVYDVSHIGHASCYIRFDIIRRILEKVFNIQPVIAIGITDIDDKIIKRANQLKIDWKALAKQYEFEFFQNLNELNILPPSFVLRVTDHIPEIIEFVTKIIDQGNAYATDDGSVYYDLKNSKYFEELNTPPPTEKEKLKSGQRHHSDFALWKGVKQNEPFWETSWGKGRPGWHIECSAMASKIFGSQLDLHSGGIDLVFPHHQNEEIQSCTFHNCDQWVNYWLHAGELQVQDEKMSKSLNNFIPIKNFLDTYSHDHLRMFCFASQYTRGLHYGSAAMKMAYNYCKVFSEFFMDCNSYIKGNWMKGNVSESELLKELDKTTQSVHNNLLDDFNTGASLNNLIELVKTTIKMLHNEETTTGGRSPGAVAAVTRYVSELFEACGFQFQSIGSSKKIQSQEKYEFIIDAVIKFRSDVRELALSCSEKPLKLSLLKNCDEIRNDLGNIGIVIKDQQNNASTWGIKNIKEKIKS